MTEAALVPPAFRALTIEDWRQFDHVDIVFHPRLTVLTGANASGKSTILNLLARHFNWSRSYSSSPLRKRRSAVAWATLGRYRAERTVDYPPIARIGSLTYGSGVLTDVNVPTQAGTSRLQYDVQLPAQQPVAGMFLTSHRSIAGNYAPVTTIPTLFGSSEQLFEQFTNELRVRWQGSWTGKSPQQALKEALMAAAVFGEGSESVEKNPEAEQIWNGYQSVLAAILPKSLGFQRLRVKVPELVVEASSGDFVLDDASGGLSAIFEVAWQVFLRARQHTSFTVLMDEPENHLHPSLQREILPSLLQAFPGVQFVVATHSPFVVTATPESAVYVLDYNESRRVDSRLLDYANKAASAEETLMRVLGLASTMPIWAERRFDDIMDRYLTGGVDDARLRALRQELQATGLVADFPQALVRLSERSDENGVR